MADKRTRGQSGGMEQLPRRETCGDKHPVSCTLCDINMSASHKGVDSTAAVSCLRLLRRKMRSRGGAGRHLDAHPRPIVGDIGDVLQTSSSQICMRRDVWGQQQSRLQAKCET